MKHLFCFVLLLSAAASARQLPPSAFVTNNAEIERFLLEGKIISEVKLPSQTHAWRIILDDGRLKHMAGVETVTPDDPSQRDYRLSVATYELDKLLELNLVAPSVDRVINGQRAAVTWWVDGVVMNEVSRRQKNIEPPDLARWNQQMQAVRLFDELVANAYRSASPALYTSTVWDNLLITREWRIWLVDHTRTFRVTTELEYPQTLTQCDRTLLGKLRALDEGVLKQRLAKYLTSEQLDALHTRRGLILRHFDDLIAAKGPGALLYDLPFRNYGTGSR